MKKKYFFIPQAHKWNVTVHKFLKLHKRISELTANGSASSDLLSRLVAKLEMLYHRLEKMQYGVGVKLAGAALSLMFLSATATAQKFTSEGPLLIPNEIQVGFASSPTFADIDGDGDLDLFVGNYFGNIVEYKNTDGQYVRSRTLKAEGTTISTAYFSNPTFADIDGDGDLDLFVGGYYGYIIEYKNDGNGNFLAGDTVKATDVNIKLSNNSAPTFADIDDDGDLDLFVGEYNGYVLEFSNDGSGNFSTADTLKVAGNKIQVEYGAVPTFADMDGDGDLDLFVGEYYGHIFEYKNDGNGNFTTEDTLQADGSNLNVGAFSNPAFIDIDNDGDLDLISGEIYGHLFKYINDNGHLKSKEIMSGITDLKVISYSCPSFTDLDGDGDLDLFVGDYYGNVLMYKNTGGTYFSLPDTLQANGNNIKVNYSASPTFEDLDKDGDLDLFVGEYGNGIIMEYKNDGNGNFATGDTLQANGSTLSVGKVAAPAFADIDGDGNLDLYVGNQAGYVLFFKNNGTEYDAGDTLRLSTGDALHVSAFAKPVFFDIDNDSDLDLVVGDYRGFIVVYKNDGGAFGVGDTLQADGANITIDARAVAPVFADLNNDGKVDLYVGNRMGNILFYKNMPGAGFSTLNNDAEVKLYPNPTDNMVTISADDSYTVTIIDLSGKTVFNGQMASNTMSLDMSPYKAGVYMVRLSNEHTVKTIKLVVE